MKMNRQKKLNRMQEKSKWPNHYVMVMNLRTKYTKLVTAAKADEMVNGKIDYSMGSPVRIKNLKDEYRILERK